MPTTKTLEKQIDSMTDEVFFQKLYQLFYPFNTRAEIARVLDLVFKLFRRDQGRRNTD